MSVKAKASYQQGDLDLLCGVYSLLNIIQLLRPQRMAQSKKLFYKVLRFLEKSKSQKLSKVITTGLKFNDIKQLLNTFLPSENLCWEMPFNKAVEPEMDQYWNTLMQLLDSNQASCVLIRLTGVHNHWTIVKAINEKTMTLHDSSKLFRINRRSCCIHSDENNKSNELWPKQTVLIYKVA